MKKSPLPMFCQPLGIEQDCRKWHLGDLSPSLPTDMGFDSFFGSLYSNDMEQFAIYRNQSIEIDAPADQSMLTRWYTDEAISFIRNDDQPFFLYFAHNFPHDPLSVRETRLGSSNGGLYGDVLEEIDEGVGEIVDFLGETGQLDNTIIILTSDNGPWFQGNARRSARQKRQYF